MRGRNGILFSHFSPYVLVTYSLPSPARAFTPSSPLKQGKKKQLLWQQISIQPRCTHADERKGAGERVRKHHRRPLPHHPATHKEIIACTDGNKNPLIWYSAKARFLRADEKRKILSFAPYSPSIPPPPSFTFRIINKKGQSDG